MSTKSKRVSPSENGSKQHTTGKNIVYHLIRDPTFIFALVILVTPVFVSFNTVDATRYFTTPAFLASFCVFGVVLVATHFLTGRTVKLDPSEHRYANWFLINGVFINLFLDVFAGQFQMMDLMSQQYVILEPRYSLGLYDHSGQTVYMTSMVELIFQVPLCLVTYWGYHHDTPWRRVTELIVSVLHVCGIWWMYVPEALRGFPHLDSDKNFEFTFKYVLYYWFGFWVCGAIWTFIPVWIVWRTGKELSCFVSLFEKQDKMWKMSGFKNM